MPSTRRDDLRTIPETSGLSFKAQKGSSCRASALSIFGESGIPGSLSGTEARV